MELWPLTAVKLTSGLIWSAIKWVNSLGAYYREGEKAEIF
jgi:hypothetical protein